MEATTAQAKPRNEKREATINLVAQLVVALPVLMIFGFTPIMITGVALFLGVAVMRFLYPTERMRNAELGLALLVGLIWLVTVIL